MRKGRIAQHGAELWSRQKGFCWICKAPIPESRGGTRVDLKPNYFGGRPKISQLGLACHSCVARRSRSAPAPQQPKPGFKVRMSQI